MSHCFGEHLGRRLRPGSPVRSAGLVELSSSTCHRSIREVNQIPNFAVWRLAYIRDVRSREERDTDEVEELLREDQPAEEQKRLCSRSRKASIYIVAVFGEDVVATTATGRTVSFVIEFERPIPSLLQRRRLFSKSTSLCRSRNPSESSRW
jgi:hypothetical protein